ncbi:hypothetical protein [Catellatospora sp. NPDC049133]|uniref:hypothetical protein n=1 Tax=Catellatospora sp. NPDC049133 TaxID=3155499 RepID=UPI0033C4E958
MSVRGRSSGLFTPTFSRSVRQPLQAGGTGFLLAAVGAPLTTRWNALATEDRAAKVELSRIIATYRHELVYQRDRLYQLDHYPVEYADAAAQERFALEVLRAATILAGHRQRRLAARLSRVVGRINVDFARGRAFVRDEVISQEAEAGRLALLLNKTIKSDLGEQPFLTAYGLLGVVLKSHNDRHVHDRAIAAALAELDAMLRLVRPGRLWR